MKSKPIRKTNHQGQLRLLPSSDDDIVPVHHLVRIVKMILDRIDVSSLETTYKGGGASSCHPKVLLKILVYTYLSNLYYSGKIEQVSSENIHFMWLSGRIKTDNNTIANFRSGKLKGRFKKIFNRVILLLVGEGYLNLKDVYLDGAKIEANANR